MKEFGLFDKKNRVLLMELVKTDFKLRYQGSFLGILWSILKPLMLFAVMYFVFVRFLKITDPTIPNYPITVLLGLSLWGFFSEAVMLGMNSIVARGDLLRKINFPKYIVILSSMMTALISLTINLLVVVIFAIVAGVKFRWTALLIPFDLTVLFLMAFGVSMILSTLYVKFRDIAHIWEVFMQALMYATPIIYPVSMIIGAKIFGVSVAKIVMLNPIAFVIQNVRHNLIAAEVSTLSDIYQNDWISIVPVAIALGMVVFGAWFFNKNSKKFAEIL